MGKYKMLIEDRRSVRTFDGRGLSAEELEQLMAFAKSADNPYGIELEYHFLNAAEHGLKSPVIAGTDVFVAVKLKRMPHHEEAMGYAFEKFVLDACSIGIGTTWIAGTMNREALEKAIDLQDDEIMPCISPLGHAAGKMSLKEKAMRKGVGADRRQKFEELFFENDFDTPLKEENAGAFYIPLQMVRLGPSAVNKQPWRILIDGERVHFYVKHGRGGVSKSVGDMQKIDLGIALCHFELTAAEEGLDVTFEIEDPCIAMPPELEYIATYKVNNYGR